MSHLSYEQRYSIEVLLKAGKSQTEIGTIISVDHLVVSFEIRRNRDERNFSYRAKLAPWEVRIVHFRKKEISLSL